MKDIIEKAVAKKQKTLSEFESKEVIEASGIPIAKQGLATSLKEALQLAREIGYPVVMKGCSHKLTHKSEMGLVKVNILNKSDATDAYQSLTSTGADMDGILVMEMIDGNREFVVGLTRDPQFGPCVMFGLGGVYTEALEDISFRVAPLRNFDARDMADEIKSQKLLGNFRGQAAVDPDTLSDILIRIGQLGIDYPEIKEIDINPLILRDGRLFAADALVVINNND